MTFTDIIREDTQPIAEKTFSQLSFTLNELCLDPLIKTFQEESSLNVDIVRNCTLAQDVYSRYSSQPRALLSMNFNLFALASGLMGMAGGLPGAAGGALGHVFRGVTAAGVAGIAAENGIKMALNAVKKEGPIKLSPNTTNLDAVNVLAEEATKLGLAVKGGILGNFLTYVPSAAVVGQVLLRTLFLMELEYDIPGWVALNSFFEEPFFSKKVLISLFSSKLIYDTLLLSRSLPVRKSMFTFF